MHTNVIHDILDFKYATPYNLNSRKSQDKLGSLIQVRKDIHRLLAAGYIAKVDEGIPIREAMQKQFYKVTIRGADSVDRKEDYKPVERKESSSLNHESIKIDVLKSFKHFYGARRFDYHVSIGGHRPDAVIYAPYKLYLEVECKDRPDKVIHTIRKWDSDTDKAPVLVVYRHFHWNPIRRFQEYTTDQYAEAQTELQKLLKIARDKKVGPRFLFVHHCHYHKLNEKVLYTADGSRYSLESYGKERGLIK